MKETTHEHEHEFEAAHGLPEQLPTNERLLWQGSPTPWAMARDVFHVRTLAVYFGVILALRAATAWSNEGSVQQAAMAALMLLPLALFALASLALLAWLSSRTTVYTLTDKRVVMRIGIVLTLTFNLPYRTIEAAGLRARTDGTGDIPLKLVRGEKIAFVHLWPHARPWRLASPEPMLRCVPNAAGVAQTLSSAWRQSTGQPLTAAVRPAAVEPPHNGAHAPSSLSPT